MKTLAIIPARGGSKGIPRKNIQALCGKPLIQYTVEAAVGCKEIERVFVSSDDDEIIAFCKSLGVDVTYKRPPHLATDEAPMIDTLIDALDYLRLQCGYMPETVALLQPTSPLRNSRHISESIKLFAEKGADTLTSVHVMREHPNECAKIQKNGWTFLANQKNQPSRRQDYDGGYVFINGAIYLAGAEYLLAHKKLVEEGGTHFYFMEPETGIDIDNYNDLRYAEFLLKHKQNNQNG